MRIMMLNENVNLDTVEFKTAGFYNLDKGTDCVIPCCSAAHVVAVMDNVFNHRIPLWALYDYHSATERGSKLKALPDGVVIRKMTTV